MQKNKKLVLATLAVFIAILGVLSISESAVLSRPFFLKNKDYPTLGMESAPIQIIVFEDFLCRACRTFSLEVFPSIQSAYIDQGVVKYVMVPLALSSDSKEMANAAYEIFDQDPEAYFPFVKTLFFHISDDKKIEFQDLIDLASTFEEIDQNKFEMNVKMERFNTMLARNLEMAKKVMKKNLRTPAIFINGFLVADHSFENLSQEIEKALKAHSTDKKNVMDGFEALGKNGGQA